MNHAVLMRKAWGAVRHVFDAETCAVSVLQTAAGGVCSRHLHRERINRFIVVTGAIDVVRYSEDATVELSRRTLGPGDIEDVPGGVVHTFEVVEPGIVVEVYMPSFNGATVRLDDIERILHRDAK